ncbi:hypothetical protein N2152v2_007972 [Parachlorella kessleri]
MFLTLAEMACSKNKVYRTLKGGVLAQGGGSGRLNYFLAIVACFSLYSLLQERLMTRPFGAQGEVFKNSLFIILVNRVVTVAVAGAALALTEHSLRPAAPVYLFAVPSVANVVASAAQYEALKYVSFPLQALAKCAKTVPVMAWGFAIGGARYRRRDYLCSVAVTAGCALFVLSGDIASPAVTAGRALGADSQQWALAGGMLLSAFLLFDGLASTSQDRLFSRYSMHSCNQLLWVTAWSAGLSLSGLLVSGQLTPAVDFVLRHPRALGLILAMSLLSTAAQLFIFATIQQYGALRFALVMTVRQFLSIVLSCLVFSHHLSLAQWAGTAMVLGALLHRARGKPRSPKAASLAKAPSGFEGLTHKLGNGEAARLIPVVAMGGSSPHATKRHPPHEGCISVDADGSSRRSSPAVVTSLAPSLAIAGGGGLPEGSDVEAAVSRSVATPRRAALQSHTAR